VQYNIKEEGSNVSYLVAVNISLVNDDAFLMILE
jgi:hypothetical protein